MFLYLDLSYMYPPHESFCSAAVKIIVIVSLLPSSLPTSLRFYSIFPRRYLMTRSLDQLRHSIALQSITLSMKTALEQVKQQRTYFVEQ